MIVRHLTGDPPDQAKRATRLLASGSELLLADLVVAECVYVLDSVYGAPRSKVAEAIRAAIGFGSIVVANDLLLYRALELYAEEGLDFGEAYLAANAEAAGIEEIVSFDKGLDRIESVRRVEP